MNAADAIVEEVLQFEDLPPGSLASRRAVVRWSDGSEGEAIRFYSDEVLVCEGDLVGHTQDQITRCTSGETATGFSRRCAAKLTAQSPTTARRRR